MSNDKMNNYRGRSVKEANMNIDQHQEMLNKQEKNISTMFQLILGISKRVFDMERKINSVIPVARASDWRSLALIETLHTRATHGEDLPTKEEIAHMAELLQIIHFDKESAEDDLRNGLETVNDEVAAPGLFAIATINLFKGGIELPEERVVRTKIELGAHELFPELDDAIIGMKVGEKKKFPLDIQGRTDFAEITLMALKKPSKPAIKDEPNDKQDSKPVEQSTHH